MDKIHRHVSLHNKNSLALTKFLEYGRIDKIFGSWVCYRVKKLLKAWDNEVVN